MILLPLPASMVSSPAKALIVSEFLVPLMISSSSVIKYAITSLEVNKVSSFSFIFSTIHESLYQFLIVITSLKSSNATPSSLRATIRSSPDTLNSKSSFVIPSLN